MIRLTGLVTHKPINKVKEETTTSIKESYTLVDQLNDIRHWVIDEQNPKKYKYLIQQIDNAIKLAKKEK